MHDCLIVGGGVVGVSLAYELARRGATVRVVERQQVGQESSWAGAGIFPPASTKAAAPPLERLSAYSLRLHAEWAERFRAELGVDNGYRRCGGWYFAGGDSSTADLEKMIADWRAGGIAVETPSPDEVREREPIFADAARSGRLTAAALLNDEVQVRNPWHMRALVTACQKLGVEFITEAPVEEFDLDGERITGVETPQGRFVAKTYCICTGAWSALVAARVGAPVLVKPIRGQIVLLTLPKQILKRIVYVGRHYLVPREEGRVLVGSTLEDAGFDRGTTAEAVRELLNFAVEWAPALGAAQVERCWAGLRPMAVDGLPYLGRLPGFANGFVAAGHYRSGLLLAPATAVVMADMIAGSRADGERSFDVAPGQPPLDLRVFAVDRETGHGR